MIFALFVYSFSHWWGFQLGIVIFEIKFKETWNFAEYIEEKSWDNPTTFLTYNIKEFRKNGYFFSFPILLETTSPTSVKQENHVWICY